MDGYLYFVDESGDLGFSAGSSKHIVFALVSVKEHKQICNALKNAKNRVLQRKGRKVPELKFSQLTPADRVRILKKICAKDFSVCAIVLKKETVRNKSLSRAAVITRYLIDQLAGYAVYNSAKMSKKSQPFQAPTVLKIDKCVSGRYEREFNSYLEAGYKKRFRQSPDIKIEQCSSQDEICIQLADLCAGSIFHKYEYGNTECYDLIKDKILNESIYFKEDTKTVIEKEKSERTR